MIEQIILSDDRIQKFYRDNDLPFPIIIWLLIKAVIYKNFPSIRGAVLYLRWQLGFDSLTQIFCKYWYLKWQLGYDSLIQISSILGYRLEIFNYQRSGWLVLLFTVWPGVYCLKRYLNCGGRDLHIFSINSFLWFSAS